uniref:Uncharacterized protein n=1 Tax=Ananas comosus var. bracteatus TaxID=296719 RepID=A0A6V7QCC3_ANACO|nr:unnamed protein product [Ananas comosus var. bracteatus]
MLEVLESHNWNFKWVVAAGCSSREAMLAGWDLIGARHGPAMSPRSGLWQETLTRVDDLVLFFGRGGYFDPKSIKWYFKYSRSSLTEPIDDSKVATWKTI